MSLSKFLDCCLPIPLHPHQPTAYQVVNVMHVSEWLTGLVLCAQAREPQGPGRVCELHGAEDGAEAAAGGERARGGQDQAAHPDPGPAQGRGHRAHLQGIASSLLEPSLSSCTTACTALCPRSCAMQGIIDGPGICRLWAKVHRAVARHICPPSCLCRGMPWCCRGRGYYGDGDIKRVASVLGRHQP